MREFKIGEVILCVKDFVMENGKIDFTKGKKYKVTIKRETHYDIIDNENYQHAMSEKYVNEYFMPLREEKLKRILK